MLSAKNHDQGRTNENPPLTLEKANEIITKYHRTTGPAQGHKFSVGLFDAKDKLVAVGIAGRPTARTFDDGETIEISGMRAAYGFVAPKSVTACSGGYGALTAASRTIGRPLHAATAAH